MNRKGHEDVTFFTGTEIEKTPAYGMKTLFVVGVQDPQIVLQEAKNSDCEHIFFGANHSFPMLEINDGDNWRDWEWMISTCLDAGFLCSLDIDSQVAEGLLESSLVEHINFIPQISVKLPYIKQYGYNAMLKLDDKDFAATNAGIWTHRLHDLQSAEAFTPWRLYTKDETIK
jgi:hypothetical protein